MDNQINSSESRGWICTRCNASNAPSVTRCDCSDSQAMQQFVAPLTTYTLQPQFSSFCYCPPNTSCMSSLCPRHSPYVYTVGSSSGAQG